MPSWFQLRSLQKNSVLGEAKIFDAPSIWGSLEIEVCFSNPPTVREAKPGSSLPAVCPERHIQGDSTFCLGLDRQSLFSGQDAIKFWNDLHSFLTLQRYAVKNRQWPRQNAYDHGSAGVYQQQAESLAAQLGITEEYAAASAGERSWITSRRLRFVDDNGKPIDGRKPCPLGCRFPRRERYPQTRRKCGHREEIAELIRLERNRRIALKEYWIERRKTGQCCGTIDNCPLTWTQSQLDRAFDRFHD